MLNEEKKLILEMIRKKGEIGIDTLVIESGMPTSKIAAALLELEFESLVESLPGKLFKA